MLNFDDCEVIRKMARDVGQVMAISQRNDLHQFAQQLEGLLRPLVDEVVALRGEIESLKAGLADAAGQIREQEATDPDSWWKGSADSE